MFVGDATAVIVKPAAEFKVYDCVLLQPLPFVKVTVTTPVMLLVIEDVIAPVDQI